MPQLCHMTHSITCTLCYSSLHHHAITVLIHASPYQNYAYYSLQCPCVALQRFAVTLPHMTPLRYHHALLCPVVAFAALCIARLCRCNALPLPTNTVQTLLCLCYTLLYPGKTSLNYAPTAFCALCISPPSHNFPCYAIASPCVTIHSHAFTLLNSAMLSLCATVLNNANTQHGVATPSLCTA